MMTLDLAVVTHRPEGIERVARMMLPPIEGVRYVVSWQEHQNAPIPPSLLRPDVEIHRFEGKGIASNRNNAIEHCRADIILFADDDILYSKNQLLSIINSFEENPKVDLLTFGSVHNSGCIYPSELTNLKKKLPKGYFVSSFEIAFRRSTAGFLRCCPELGLGSAELHGGEDEMFLRSAIRRDLNCRFFPITICEHPGASTGTKAHFTNKNLQACGCVIALTYPLSSILRIPLKAWRVSRKGQATISRALYYITRGALMAPGVLKRNHLTLW
ncbi:MAG: glycosyltransferase family 2 protein [Bacteroides sp.]|nr:glycosyltransferase family 2 protein [Bacteroides sp.]MCM1379791.1 glycosyltransferase family 2 protein [Bacteroides sp.]MCM1446150.1 glycosyltransferase family 2 protein [Prevotella sp.]